VSRDQVSETPDGRYIIVRGRLWRKADPRLPESVRQRLVANLMAARRAVKEAAADNEKRVRARAAVHAAKVALGERGPVWWTDGTPDLTRHLAKNTPYGNHATAGVETRKTLATEVTPGEATAGD